MSEPAAFGIECDGRLLASYTCEDEESAQEMARRFEASGMIAVVVPLYRSPALTDAQREAIHWCIGDVADVTGPVEDTLRGMLERMVGER